MMRPLLLALCAGLGVGSVPAAETTATWAVASGNYGTGANWSTGTTPINGSPLPGDSYAVIVASGILTLNVSPTVNSFSLSNAILNVSGARTLTGTKTFGVASTIASGQLTLAGATALSAGNSDVYLGLNAGVEVSNSGTFTHSATGTGETALVLNADKSASAGSIFRNNAGGAFIADTAANDASIGYGAVNSGNLFVNAGTFTKTGTHNYAANVAFQNTGTVNVQQGALHLNAGDGGSTSGAFAVSNGATLAIGSTLHFASGASVSGAGTLQMKSGLSEFASGSSFSAANLQILSGTVSFLAGSTLGAATLTMSGGTLDLDIAHTFTGASLGAGGTVIGDAHVTFVNASLGSGNYVFGGSGLKEFSGTTAFATGATSQYFNVNGSGEVSNTGAFTQIRNGSGENAIVLNADSTGGASVFRNASGGTFTANMSAGDGSVGFAAASSGNRFINEGSFVKTGGSAYAFNVPLTNNGSVSVQQGALNVNSGGTASGSFALTSGTTLGLNGTLDFSSGGAITGAGTVKVNGGATTFLSGSSFSAATLQLVSGVTAFRLGSSLGATTLAVAGGTLELDIDHTFTGAGFTNGGSVTGTGHTIFAGTTTFDQNTYVFGGAGVKEFTGTVALETVSVNQYFNINGGSEVKNSGSFTQTRTGSGASAIILNANSVGGASIFRNAAGATFTAAMNGGAGGIGAAAATAGNKFINEGSFTKTGWSDYNVDVAFANSGTAEVQTGVLAFNGGDGGSSTGLFQLQSNGTLTFSGGFTLSTGAVISGAGTFLSKGGATTFGPGSSFTASNLKVSGGTTAFRTGSLLNNATALTITGGTLELDIDHTFNNASIATGATIGGAGVTTFAGSIALTATTLTISGSGVKTFSGSTTFAPGATDSYLNLTSGAQITNTGTFTQTKAGNGASAIVLASDGIGASIFRNASIFAADITSNTTASMGYGGAASGGNKFVNTGTFNKTGIGTYQINVAVDNSGSIHVAQGTLSITAGVTGDTGSVAVDSGSSLNLSENSHPSATGTLVHNGTTLALGTNDLTIAGDYQNANFGSGNSFNGRAHVTGSGKILARTGTTLAYGNDATSGTVQFGVVHVGDVVTKNYSVQNTGTAGVSVRGAFQTTAGGASITDSRLSGAGLAAADFGKLDPGAATANRAITFTASTPGALTGQQLHVATNFDNVTLANLAIQGSANYYADPAWTNATGSATLTKNSATSYTLSFGTINSATGLLAADFDLLNALHDAIYQDTLGGSFNLAGVTHFTLMGFGAFSDVTSGSSDHGFSITLDSAAQGNGVYSDVLILNPTSSNASGTSNLAAIQLTIQATVVPEPGTTALLVFTGLMLAGLHVARRRRTRNER